MTKLLVVEKLGSIKETILKSSNSLLEDLYKKAGFKVVNGFQLHHKFIDPSDTNLTIELYGKTSGRAGQENKYDFPPPMDNTLFFGNCILVCKQNENVIDLSKARWEKIYESLFGGFEDTNSVNNSEEENEIDEETQVMNDPKVQLTKQGYIKDDFVVDDEEEEDDDNDVEDGSTTEEEVVIVKKTTGKKPPSKRVRNVATSRSKVNKKVEVLNEPYTCVEELSEEEYFK